MNLPPPFQEGHRARCVSSPLSRLSLGFHRTQRHLTDDERGPRAHTISDPILWDRKKKLGK